MSDDYQRSIESLIAIVLGCIGGKAHRLMKCDGEKEDNRRAATTLPRGDFKCPTAPRIPELAELRDAQFVMASLVLSGTTRGETHFAPGSASIASELAGQVITIGCPGSRLP
jgi:hypothetical protein